MATTAAPVSVSLRARVGAYVALTKPRIIELLLVTTVPTMIVAEEGLPSLWLIVATVIGGTLAAGGANAINMYVDRDIDALMKRTQNRPLVTGVIEPANALVFAVAHRGRGLRLAVGVREPARARCWPSRPASSTCSSTRCGSSARSTQQHRHRRRRRRRARCSSAGRRSPATLAWAPVVLFAVIFFWTPPHFWALAIRYKDDYAAADVPMLPSVASLHTTAVRIVAYTVVVWALSLVFVPGGRHGAALQRGGALVLGAVFTWLAVEVLRTESPEGGHAPVHLLDHLHHVAVRGHGPRRVVRYGICRRAWRRRRRVSNQVRRDV